MERRAGSFAGAVLLGLVATGAAEDGVRARLAVETEGASRTYRVDAAPGRLAVRPEGDRFAYWLEPSSGSLRLVDEKAELVYRVPPARLAELVRTGLVPPDWFPWGTIVAADLVADLAVERAGTRRLPDGRPGPRVVVRSRRYGRVVADYGLDPRLPRAAWLTWTRAYRAIWRWTAGLDAEEAEAAERWLGLIDEMEAAPAVAEERLRLLSRPVVRRIERWEPLAAEAVALPEGLVERPADDLYWEGLRRRLEEWLKPPGRPSAPP